MDLTVSVGVGSRQSAAAAAIRAGAKPVGDRPVLYSFAFISRVIEDLAPRDSRTTCDVRGHAGAVAR